jgi:hypothetical protein
MDLEHCLHWLQLEPTHRLLNYLHWLQLEPTHLLLHYLHWLQLEPTHLLLHYLHWLQLEPTHLLVLDHSRPLPAGSFVVAFMLRSRAPDQRL